MSLQSREPCLFHPSTVGQQAQTEGWGRHAGDSLKKSRRHRRELRLVSEETTDPCEPDTLQMSSHFILTIALYSKYYSHFIGEEIESQRIKQPA